MEFYVLVHVAASKALNFLVTLCFSSLTRSGSVAACSVSYQCSHDKQHVGSESNAVGAAEADLLLVVTHVVEKEESLDSMFAGRS